MTQKPPLRCRDCKYSRSGGIGFSAFCVSPITTTYDAVGDKQWPWCRDNRSIGECGPEAKLFVPYILTYRKVANFLWSLLDGA